jgi:hypothetical protein
MSPRNLLLTLALIVSPVAAGDGNESFSPRDVAVVALDDAQALVAWTPGEIPADSYRVYGIDANGPVLLVDSVSSLGAATLATVVTGGFPSYAVSGVKGGVESARTIGTGVGCVTVTLYPTPDVSTRCPPARTETLPVEVRSPL